MKRNSSSRTRRVRGGATAVAIAAVAAWLTFGTGTATAAPAPAGDQPATVAGHAATSHTATLPTKSHGVKAAHATGHASAHGNSHATSGTSGTSGDPTQKQPLSGADQNSGGANGQCTGATYCSTRDGSASGNGNGGGKATGKPCAGCVGKADNKNPPGQEKTDPSNTFPNNGYECDRNHGIGRTNPAHTGCTPPPTCDSSVEDCGSPPPACVPTAANHFCSTVEGEHHTRNPKPATKVLGEKVTRTPEVLPFTGAARIGFMVGMAGLALAAGAALTAGGRRRRGHAG